MRQLALRAAKGFGVLDAAEAFGKAQLIFQRFEVAFQEWVVVGRVSPVMRPGDAQVRQ